VVDERLEFEGLLDAHAAEALRLEVRRIAERCGVELVAVRIEPAREPAASD
jgi:hypothetical protein